MKYMTKEEDILTSVNLIQQGVVLDKLLEHNIDKTIKLEDMLIGDKNFNYSLGKNIAYGKNYEFNYTDSLVKKLVNCLTKLKETK